MKYLKLFEIFGSDLKQDLEDILVELTDSGNRIDIYQIDDNTIKISFVPTSSKNKLDTFFKSDEFKRAYYYLRDNGFTKYYMCLSGVNKGHHEFNEPSSSFDNPEPWLINFDTIFHEFIYLVEYGLDKIEMEFHKPELDKYYVIGWCEEDESDWEPAHFSPLNREEADALLVKLRSQEPNTEMVKRGIVAKFKRLSDNQYWDRQRYYY